MVCEKCWSDAYMRMLTDTSKSQSEHYHDLLKERKDNPCPIEQQLGDVPGYRNNKKEQSDDE